MSVARPGRAAHWLPGPVVKVEPTCRPDARHDADDPDLTRAVHRSIHDKVELRNPSRLPRSCGGDRYSITSSSPPSQVAGTVIPSGGLESDDENLDGLLNRKVAGFSP